MYVVEGMYLVFKTHPRNAYGEKEDMNCIGIADDGILVHHKFLIRNIPAAPVIGNDKIAANSACLIISGRLVTCIVALIAASSSDGPWI